MAHVGPKAISSRFALVWMSRSDLVLEQDPTKSLVTLRSLSWPGYIAYHVGASKSSVSRAVFGQGLLGISPFRQFQTQAPLGTSGNIEPASF